LGGLFWWRALRILPHPMDLQIGLPEPWRPEWQARKLAKHMREALKTVEKTAQDRWKDRWTKANKLVRKPYAKRRKAAGFAVGTTSWGVPQVRSRRCTCRMVNMTVKHVILVSEIR
jgi:hypothetical protein